MEIGKKHGVIRVDRQSLFTLSYIAFLINYVINGYEFGTPVETVRITACMLLLCCIIQKRNHNKIIYVQGFLLAITAVISLLYSDSIDISESRIWNYLFCVLLFVLISTTDIKTYNFELILKTYINFAFVLSLIVIIGYLLGFGIDEFGRASIYYGGFYKDQNYLSAYFMPAFAIKMYDIILRHKRIIVNWVYPFCFLLATFLMGSRGSFLTALLISFVLILRMLLFEKNIIRKVGLILLLIIGTIIILYIFYNSPQFLRMTGFKSYGSDVRLRLWNAGLTGFRKNKWLGNGIGSASMYSWAMVGNAVHNCFIEIISDHGIIGAAIVLWTYLRVFKLKGESRFYSVIFYIGLFAPLFFLTGYSNLTFWMPMFLFQNFISWQYKIEKNCGA